MRFQKFSSVIFAIMGLVSGCSADSASLVTKEFAKRWQMVVGDNGVDLNGVEINAMVHNGLELYGYHLNGANLNGTNLNGTNFNGANLNGANLNGTNLNGIVNGTSTTVSGRDLIGSTVTAEIEDDNNDVQELTATINNVVCTSCEACISDPTGNDCAVCTADTETPCTGVFLYYLRWVDGGDGTPLCGVNTLSEDVPAVALSGLWDYYSGNHSTSSTQHTFACINAAVGKCALWGYHPWVSSAAADAHQSCTRMVRADYCGDGTPHTTNGTPINFWDDLPIQTETTGMSVASFTNEAEWTPNGARCIQRTRYTAASAPAQTLGSDRRHVQVTCGSRLVHNDPPCNAAPTDTTACPGSACVDYKFCACTDNTSCNYATTGRTCNTSTGHCETPDTSCWNSTSDFFRANSVNGTPTARRDLRNSTGPNT